MTTYLLPEGVDLAERLDVRAERPRTETWTVYDTFDGRLHAAQRELIHRGGALVLSDGAKTPQPTAPARLFAQDLGALQSRLEPVIEMRALTPMARLKVRRTDVAVRNEDAKTVARIALLESAAGARLSLTAVRGYDAETAQVARTLGLEPATTTLADAAIADVGGRPAGTSSKLDVALEPGQRADAAAGLVLRRLNQVIRDNLPGTLADVDTEFLHDLRVAVRRTRSLQRQFKRVFAPAEIDRFRSEFRGLQGITGETRDLDVQLLEFPDQAELAALRGVLEQRRRRAFRAMARELRASPVLDEWEAYVDGLVASPDAERPWAARPVEELAATRIAAVYRSMVKAGRRIGDDSPHEALHDLRKVGKELRYLLEFFGGLYPAAVVKPLVKSLKSLQDVLGRFQDREVQAEELRGLRDEVARAPGGPEALMAMGLLVDRLLREQHEARAEFAAQFEAFASATNRALVKETFA